MSGFDRDLGVAGRVMTRASDGSIVQKLVKVDRPSMFSSSSTTRALLIYSSPPYSYSGHSPGPPGKLFLQQGDAIVPHRWPGGC